MVNSDTEVCNLALTHQGIGKEIADLETERSEEAKAYRRVYYIAKEKVLRDFFFSFSRKIADLELVEEDPNDEWSYSYRYPTDCLDAKRILSGEVNDSRQSRVPYLIGQDSAGKLIFTEMADARLEYACRIDDISKWPPDAVLALSFLSAHYTAARLTKGDPFGISQRCLNSYLSTLTQAKINSLNEEQPFEEVDSEFIRVRS